MSFERVCLAITYAGWDSNMSPSVENNFKTNTSKNKTHNRNTAITHAGCRIQTCVGAGPVDLSLPVYHHQTTLAL